MRAAAVWRTTAFRSAVLYTLIVSVAVSAALGWVYWTTVGAIERQTVATIEAEVQGLSEQFRAGGLARLATTIERRSRAEPGTPSVYMLATPQLRRVAGNLNRWPEGAPDNGRFILPLRRVTEDGVVSRHAEAQAFKLPGGYRLLVARDTEDLQLVRKRFLGAILWIGGGALVFGLATGYLLSRRVLTRVARAAEVGERIAAGHLESRLPVGSGADELDRLAGSVNAMMDRIEGLMTGMRIATDSISHDLKKPLTRLRARLELAEGDPDTLGAALEEVDATVTILDNLLRIARAEAGVTSTDFSDTDLGQMVQDAVDLYRPLAEARGVELEVDAPALVRPVERQLMAQALTNLIDNALKYAPDRHGKVTIAARELDDGRAVLSVQDNGPGIPAEDRARVIERFVRLEPSRQGDGAGLGLSLAASVARVHGGQLTLADAEPGLVARLEF